MVRLRLFLAVVWEGGLAVSSPSSVNTRRAAGSGSGKKTEKDTVFLLIGTIIGA